MAAPQHDLIIICAGPGGYTAAIRAAQLGLNVACVEKEPALGGTCLRIGCIRAKRCSNQASDFEKSITSLRRTAFALPNVELDLATMLKRKDQIVTTLTRGVDALSKKPKSRAMQAWGELRAQDGSDSWTAKKVPSN